MLSTLVFDAPAGIGGPGRVRASAHGCGTLLPSALRRATSMRGTGLPWSALLIGADRTATGGALPVAVAGRITEQPVALQPFATTHPYSTLGNHSPGRPQS
jgi:hypothetical protein